MVDGASAKNWPRLWWRCWRCWWLVRTFGCGCIKYVSSQIHYRISDIYARLLSSCGPREGTITKGRVGHKRGPSSIIRIQKHVTKINGSRAQYYGRCFDKCLRQYRGSQGSIKYSHRLKEMVMRQARSTRFVRRNKSSTKLTKHRCFGSQGYPRL